MATPAADSTVPFVVLYRWRIRPEREAQFVAAWRVMTEALLARGSLGSRLHRSRAGDGMWYSYAQWTSDKDRQRALSEGLDAEAIAAVRDAVEERFEEVPLAPVADYLMPLGAEADRGARRSDGTLAHVTCEQSDRGGQ
jgi:hypothetical protein